jgi:hypothetical protein
MQLGKFLGRPPLVYLLQNRRRFLNGLINEEIFSGVWLGRIECVDDLSCRQQGGSKQDGVLTFFGHEEQFGNRKLKESDLPLSRNSSGLITAKAGWEHPAFAK